MQCGGAKLAGNRGDGGNQHGPSPPSSWLGMVDFCLVGSGVQPVLGSELFPDPLPQVDPWGDGMSCMVLPWLCELRACL